MVLKKTNSPVDMEELKEFILQKVMMFEYKAEMGHLMLLKYEPINN